MIFRLSDRWERLCAGNRSSVASFLPLAQKLVDFMIDSVISRIRFWFHPKKGVIVEKLADFIFGFTLRSTQAKRGLAKYSRY